MYLAEVKNVPVLLLLILRAVLHSCFSEPPVGDVIVVGAWRWIAAIALKYQGWLFNFWGLPHQQLLLFHSDGGSFWGQQQLTHHRIEGFRCEIDAKKVWETNQCDSIKLHPWIYEFHPFTTAIARRSSRPQEQNSIEMGRESVSISVQCFCVHVVVRLERQSSAEVSSSSNERTTQQQVKADKGGNRRNENWF